MPPGSHGSGTTSQPAAGKGGSPAPRRANRFEAAPRLAFHRLRRPPIPASLSTTATFSSRFIRFLCGSLKPDRGRERHTETAFPPSSRVRSPQGRSWTLTILEFRRSATASVMRCASRSARSASTWRRAWRTDAPCGECRRNRDGAQLLLTCDPISGVVQIPSIGRNVMGAVKTITTAHLPLRSDRRLVVSLSMVIRTMREAAANMLSGRKETSRGGLAIDVIEC